MPETQEKTLREVQLVAPKEKIRWQIIRTTIFRLLSAPLPFLWIDIYRTYMRWASSFMRARATARLRFFVILSATITFSLNWLYFGGSFTLLLSIFLMESIIVASFLLVLFVWIFFHVPVVRPRVENRAVSELVNISIRSRTAKAAMINFRKQVAIAFVIGLVTTVIVLDIYHQNPFPAIVVYGETDNAAGQILFTILAVALFDICMTFFCWNGFKIVNRTPLIKTDDTINFREAKDPTPEEFYLGAIGEGYIPPVPLSFDFERFEQNFMIFGAPNMARENMVNWLLMCAFANPNTIAVCLDGGRNDDIAFRHLRNIPGVFIGEINDGVSNTYGQIINWVCWLADLADEAFMKRHAVRPNWRPDDTRLVVFCDPEITDIVMKKNLRKVKTERRTGKMKVVWQHPLYDIVEPMEKLFSYGKSHNITFVCVAKHMYHQLSVPKDKRDAFYNIVYYYRVNDVLPDGTEGWITVKTPAYKHTFGVNFRDEFIIGTAPEVRNAELAEYIVTQMRKSSSATWNLWDRAAGEVPHRPIADKRPRVRPVMVNIDDNAWKKRDESSNGTGNGTNGNGRDKKKQAEIEN